MKESTENIMAKTLSRAEMHKVTSERIAEISREFTEGFAFLEEFPKSVTFSGSNQFKEDNPYYQSARTLAGRMVKELGYSVVSGGGPGIMEAADRGAFEAGDNSLDLLIKLPNAQPVNAYITKSVSFYYFFARKVCLAFGAEVFIFYPGGFGTFDEFFEILTLIQTRKIMNVPLICVGSVYWNPVKDLMRKNMLARGTISDGDLDLFTVTDNLDEIIDIIKQESGEKVAPLPEVEVKIEAAPASEPQPQAI